MSISNINLNAVVNDKIRSERNNTIAKASLLRLFGLGSMVTLSSLGVAVAFLAINYQPNRFEQSQKIAMSFANSLEKTKLQANASGNVELDKNASVTLEKNQIVSVDPRSKLKIDPNSTLEIKENMQSTIQIPTARQLGIDKKSNSFLSPKTTYTQFKYANYNEGFVITGWVYDPNETNPKTKYCYYSRSVGSLESSRIDLAINGSNITNNDTSEININDALKKCQW